MPDKVNVSVGDKVIDRQMATYAVKSVDAAGNFVASRKGTDHQFRSDGLRHENPTEESRVQFHEHGVEPAFEPVPADSNTVTLPSPTVAIQATVTPPKSE